MLAAPDREQQVCDTLADDQTSRGGGVAAFPRTSCEMEGTSGIAPKPPRGGAGRSEGTQRVRKG